MTFRNPWFAVLLSIVVAVSAACSSSGTSDPELDSTSEPGTPGAVSTSAPQSGAGDSLGWKRAEQRLLDRLAQFRNGIRLVRGA